MADVSCVSPIEAPPPAYEIAQLNFDEKIAVAAERSLDLSQSRRHDEQDALEKASDEVSDDARKSHALKRSDLKSNRSPPALQDNEQRPTVRPLTLRRKTRHAVGSSASVAREKERPSWFDEARLASSNSGVSGRPLSLPGETRPDIDSRSHYYHQPLLSEDCDEDHSVPPPTFAAVDTSLDVQYASNNAFRRRPGGTIVLRYAGDDYSGSPSPSPPHSPSALSSSHRSHYRRRSGSPQVNAPRNMHPSTYLQSGLQVTAPLVRPRSAEPRPLISALPPRLSFDPSVAYEGTRSSSLFDKISADVYGTAHDATALYSPAVAPLLSSQKPRPTPSKVRRYTPSVSSLPEYEQQQQNTQAVQGRKSMYSMLDYAASNASVYTQNSVNVPQYPQVAQHPQTAQYPARQDYNRPMSVVQQNGNVNTASWPYSQSYSR